MSIRLPPILPLAVLALTTGACSTTLDNFDVPVSARATVPKASLAEMLLGQLPAFEGFTRFDVTQTQTFKNSEYGPEDVDSVILESLVLRVVSPAGQDLSFFGASGEIIFSLGTSGLPTKEIAKKSGFPPGSASVAFTTTADDLKDYVLAKEADVTTQAKDARRPNQDTTVEIEAIFDVDIKVL